MARHGSGWRIKSVERRGNGYETNQRRGDEENKGQESWEEKEGRLRQFDMSGGMIRIIASGK